MSLVRIFLHQTSTMNIKYICIWWPLYNKKETLIHRSVILYGYFFCILLDLRKKRQTKISVAACYSTFRTSRRQIRAERDVDLSCRALCCRGCNVITLPADRSGKPGRKRGRGREREGERQSCVKRGLKSCAASSSSSYASPLLRWKVRSPRHLSASLGLFIYRGCKETERPDCDTPCWRSRTLASGGRGSPNSALRCAGWLADRAGATRPPVKVGRIPDSWFWFCLCFCCLKSGSCQLDCSLWRLDDPVCVEKLQPAKTAFDATWTNKHKPQQVWFLLALSASGYRGYGFELF